MNNLVLLYPGKKHQSVPIFSYFLQKNVVLFFSGTNKPFRQVGPALSLVVIDNHSIVFSSQPPAKFNSEENTTTVNVHLM